MFNLKADTSKFNYTEEQRLREADSKWEGIRREVWLGEPTDILYLCKYNFPVLALPANKYEWSYNQFISVPSLTQRLGCSDVQMKKALERAKGWIKEEHLVWHDSTLWIQIKPYDNLIRVLVVDLASRRTVTKEGRAYNYQAKEFARLLKVKVNTK